jgi:nicotinamidase-related amidase
VSPLKIDSILRLREGGHHDRARPRDIVVIKKQKPSGFFGTNLASYLTLLGCDSVIVVGTTTSGCVPSSTP